MSSLRTFFRAVVMLVTLGILAKAWYHYGPTVGELQAIGGRVAQLAQEAWANYWDSPQSSSPLAVDDSQATLATPPAPFVPPAGPLMPTRLPTLTPQDSPAVQLAGNTVFEPASPGGVLWADAPSPSTNAPPADPLQLLLERLTQHGASDQELTPWGSRGELVRFTCRVPWGGSANFTRQFEAVATTPQAAVEQVAAEIEVWRSAR